MTNWEVLGHQSVQFLRKNLPTSPPPRQQMCKRHTQIPCSGKLSCGTQNVAETTAGEGNHMRLLLLTPHPKWSHTSITCSGRNPWWVSVGNTIQRHETAKWPDISCPSLCFSALTLPALHTVTEEVKVCCAWLQSNWLFRETIAAFQAAFMVRIEDSWWPQSFSVFACLKHNGCVMF